MAMSMRFLPRVGAAASQARIAYSDVLSLRGAQRLLVASDSVIEGRHTPLGIDPYAIGRKAVLRNVSDVAAMANARPIATVASVVLPWGISDLRAWRLYEGLRETAAAWEAPLVGGDIATGAADDSRACISVSVTILAVPLDESCPVATRNAAMPGDAVYVTGTIGGAWDPTTGLGRHLDFTPRVAAANALWAQLGDRLGAMLDVSDGLGRDLGHIADASRVTIEIELDRIPLTVGCDARSALAHGEDYELAFTARGQVPGEVAGVRVTRIGSVLAGPPSVFAREGVSRFDARNAGFEHGAGGAG